MPEINWILKQALVILHSEAIKLYGGVDGIRDENLLDSALTRPINIHLYENENNIIRLSAVYGIAIAKNHAFVDGNKRVAFLAMGLFLRLNGFRLIANQMEATEIMLKIASSEITESELIQWIHCNIT